MTETHPIIEVFDLSQETRTALAELSACSPEVIADTCEQEAGVRVDAVRNHLLSIEVELGPIDHAIGHLQRARELLVAAERYRRVA